VLQPDIASLAQLQKQYQDLKVSSSSEQTDQFQKQLAMLVSYYRSPKLGIGNEGIKQKLKEMSEQLKAIDHIVELN